MTAKQKGETLSYLFTRFALISQAYQIEPESEARAKWGPPKHFQLYEIGCCNRKKMITCEVERKSTELTIPIKGNIAKCPDT